MKGLLLAPVLTAALLGLLAAPAFASPKTFYVHPSGGNDTAHIQKAFARAVAAGPGSVVQLTAGHFYTDAIYVKNFHGYFTGAGQGKTFIDTLRGIDPNAAPLCSVTVDNHGKFVVSWPALFCFEGGTVHVSDMTAAISDPAPAAQWNAWGAETTALGDVFEATGTHAVAFSRLTFDTPPNSGDDGGYDVDCDIQVTGHQHLDANGNPTNLGTTGGSVSITGCTFLGNIGAFVSGLTHGRLMLTGNSFNDGFIGFNGAEESASQIVIAHNRMDVGWCALWLGQGGFASDQAGAPLPAPPAPRYLIADNDLACANYGVALADWYDYLTGTEDLAAIVCENRLDLGSADSPAGSGILQLGTQGIRCWHNSFSGYAATGITLGDDQLPDGSYFRESGWRIVGNDFRKLTASTASVYLGQGTTRCLVVGGAPPTTVLNNGTDNTLINVTPVTASAPALSMRAGFGSKVGLVRRVR